MSRSGWINHIIAETHGRITRSAVATHLCEDHQCPTCYLYDKSAEKRQLMRSLKIDLRKQGVIKNISILMK